MSLNIEKKPKRIEELMVTQSEGSFVLTEPGTGRTMITNRVGAHIVELADGSRGVAAIVGEIAARYPSVSGEKIGQQVTRFLDDGARKGILSWIEEAREHRSSLPIVFEQPVPAGAGTSGRDDLREQERRFHPDIYWYLTFRCNLSCAHCSVQSSPWVDNSHDLDTAACLQVVEQMAEMNVDAAMLSGGEVLIRPDALTILRALGEKGIYIGLETNGLRFDRAFVEVARDLQVKGLLGMTISLDGGTRETHEILRGPHSFDRTVRGLRFLKENGVKFDVQCVLNSANYQTIPEIYDLAAELHPECGAVILSALNAAGRGEELIKRIGLTYSLIPEVFELIHEHKGRYPGISLIKFPPAMVPPKHLLTVYKGRDVGCSTSCKFPLLGVLPDGSITVCALGRSDTNLYFGNVRETRLKDAWEKAHMDLMRSRYVTAENLQGICADCVWKQSCKGSCRAWAYAGTGDFEAAYPVCQQAADEGYFPDAYRISKQGGRAVRETAVLV